MATVLKIGILTFSVVFVISTSAQTTTTGTTSVKESAVISPPPITALSPQKDSILIKHPEKTVLAFKTNMLYDALTLLNISIECPFAKNHLSLLYEHQFPWWRGGDYRNKFCLRYLQMCGEFRWWFLPKPQMVSENRRGRDRLVGHFIGTYIMGGKYDFQRKRDICYQGEFWSTGISYGYVMPLGKTRLNLEFSISIGYASIPYRHFFPSEDYSKLFLDTNKIGKWHYWGITKIGITLVYPLTISNKKGGKR